MEGVHKHDHGHACDCAAHRRRESAPVDAGTWSALLPVLACAVCPACLTTYAKLLSVAGVGLGLSELQHLVLLAVAVGASIAVSAWRTWRTGRLWPLGVALTGSSLVAVGHLVGELHAVEWVGVLVLLAGGLSEHFRLRQRRLLQASAS